MRQVAIDAASIPKDAKIAVLEKSTAESEKMIAEARSDKLKQTAEFSASDSLSASLSASGSSFQPSSCRLGS